MELDPAAYQDSMHRIITTLVSPRPIGWISTRTDRRDNLAPYSYFNVVSTSPPVVMFSGSTDDGEPKDAGRMAVETGEFVVNLVTEDLVELMDATSAPLDDVSEFDFVGLERADAKVVDAPRVAAAAACLECTLYDTKEIHDNLVVFGSVEHIYVDERLTTDGVVDIKKVDSVGRLGGPYYTSVDMLDVERRNFGPWDGASPPGFAVDDETPYHSARSASSVALRIASSGSSFDGSVTLRADRGASNISKHPCCARELHRDPVAA